MKELIKDCFAGIGAVLMFILVAGVIYSLGLAIYKAAGISIWNWIQGGGIVFGGILFLAYTDWSMKRISKKFNKK